MLSAQELGSLSASTAMEPLFRTYFFADDLVLYGRASMDTVSTIELVLLDFYISYGDLGCFSTPFTLSGICYASLSICCLYTSDRLDFFRWHWNSQFTVRSAYMKSMEHSWDPPSKDWDIVWSLSVPQRVQVFLWLAMRQKLMTNLECQRHYLCDNVSCSRCSFAESTIYVLCDCSYARQVWGVAFPPSPCQWYPPPSQWICLNADGGVCPATKFAKASGLLRDSCGTWTRGYGHSIGITDVLTAELWAIHDGLIAAWELGFEFVQVQSDCAKAISALSVDNASRDSCALVRGIHSLCHRGWTIDFAWIPREANQVADQLIKNLPLSQFEQVYINAPPAHLVDLLTRDINGPPYN
ncbi:hypothetical protein V6N11_069757 [Hibiscus sabdariffa]|uniref:RNase H type-1 domain-containing protein n=1 Tax=Hibiscus sabdariffa TaxID=183260 RepID=A0ABR2Q3N6_9ROSI